MVDSAITFTPGEVSAYYASSVPHLEQTRTAEWRGACPIHHGKDDNFAVEPDTGRWYCHSTCGRGGDILDLEAALNGGGFPTRKAKVFCLVGRTEPEYRHNSTHTNGNSATGAAGGLREVARYPYTDRDGNLLFEVIRYLKPDGEKGFRQCRPNGRGGVIWNLDGIERVPYRLPKLLTAGTLYLPEGEKDVHTLEAWGLVASCNSGGSGSSHLYAGWTKYFRDRHIVILPDNDGPGRKHAAAVAAALLNVAASIRIVELPGLPTKGDVTDWRDEGGTRERFLELTKAAAVMDAAALYEWRARWGLADEEPHQTCAEAAGDWPKPAPIQSELPPVQTFSEDLLPDSFRPLVTDVTDRMQVPMDYPAVAMVLCLAGAVNRRAVIQPKANDTGWVIVPNLWGGIIAAPGFIELLVSGIHVMMSSLHSAVLPSPSKGYEKIIRFSLPIFEYHDRHRHTGVAKMGPKGRAIIHEHLQKVIASLISEDVRKALLSRRKVGGQIPPAVLVQYVASTFILVLNWWAESKGPLRSPEANELFRALVLPTLAEIFD